MNSTQSINKNFRIKSFCKTLAILSTFIFAFSLLFAPPNAVAQDASAQNCVIGIEKLEPDINFYLDLAEEIMTSKNYTIYIDGGYVRLGGNEAVYVEVVCAPGNNKTIVTVTAFSSDWDTAELAKNEVLAYIRDTKKL